MRLLVVVALLSLCSCLETIVCTGSKVFARFLKRSENWGSEESFKVYGGGSLLYTSPTFVKYTLRTIEVCLEATINNLYTLEMKDSRGDSWTDGAWLEIQGIHNNTVYKGFLVESRTETYPFSLYYGIDKSATWKFASGSIASTWTLHSFEDQSWANFVYGQGETTTAAGTQYYRHKFTGLVSMPAYELRIRYSNGVVAYINGVEIFRDNVGTGPITSSSIATTSYDSIEYHGVVRSGSDISASESVLAVELHYMDLTSINAIELDAFLAQLESTVMGSPCFTSPYDPEISGSGTSSSKAFNWKKQDSMSISTLTKPATLTYSYVGNVYPVANGVNVFPYTSPIKAMKDFTLNGSMNTTVFNNIMSVTGWTYNSKKWKNGFSFSDNIAYRNYQVVITETASGSLSVMEMHLLVCNNAPPSLIVFKQANYTFISRFQQVVIETKLDTITGCTISPELPAGLSIDFDTCRVSGISSTALETTTFTMHSTIGGGIDGTFTLTLTVCSGTMVELLRTYKTSSMDEGFILKSVVTGETIYSIAPNSGQINSKDWKDSVCIPAGLISVEMTCTSSYWTSDSFLWISTFIYGQEMENIAMLRYDSYLAYTSAIINVHHTINGHSSWFYKMGEVPDNWYNNATNGWTESLTGQFPTISHVQLYKKNFSIATLENSSGFVLLLKYKYGCIIYLNGHEAFRNGITGPLSTSSISSNTYSNLMYRSVSFPFSTTTDGITTAIDFLIAGQNTIAVALVGSTTEQKTSNFDLTIRLMSSDESRVLDVSPSSSGVSGGSASPFDMYYSTYSYSSSCSTSNYISATFGNDRREWINSIMVQNYYSNNDSPARNFIVKARNPDMSNWVTLETVEGLTWSMPAQKRSIWIHASMPYNQYRFEAIQSGIDTTCSWRINELDLQRSIIPSVIPALAYESTVIYRNVEMSEIYPNSILYTHFQISPSLPIGIKIDPYDGVISGTTTVFMNSTVFTVSANKVTGENVTAIFTLSVELCFGGRNLMTVAMRVDGNGHENQFRVYRSRGTSGTIIRSYNRSPVISAFFYIDMCLPHDLYTFQGIDTEGDGWGTSTGFYLTVDVGALRYDMGMLASGTAPTHIERVFSSNIPFQIDHDIWKVLKDEHPKADWMSRGYDDATWKAVKAANIGLSEDVTVYIRKTVVIPSLSDYQVLNVNMRFAGGVVVYFNGNVVARFNLPEAYNEYTEGLIIRDYTAFSSFHILLAMAGAVEGDNIFAVEVHRARKMAITVDIEFDATGVFGVEDCSTVIDSFVDITGNKPSSGLLTNLFDLDPTTTTTLINTNNVQLSWFTENLEGSRFNYYGMYTNAQLSLYSFSLYGRQRSTDEFETISEVVDFSTPSRNLTLHEAPVGVASYREFRFEVDDPASSAPVINSFVFRYCKASGSSCPAVDSYPSVSEGQISPSSCPYGYRGYAYRVCKEGKLQDIIYDRCVFREPAFMMYSELRYILVRDTMISTGVPKYDNIIKKFYIQENQYLPNGLQLNNVTGEIYGKPLSTTNQITVTIYGENPSGATLTAVSFLIKKGECLADGKFGRTPVGEIAQLDCSLKGSYTGVQERACVLGTKDGEWQPVKGFCMSIALIVVLIVLTIIVFFILVVCIVRCSSNNKGNKKSLKPSLGNKSVEV